MQIRDQASPSFCPALKWVPASIMFVNGRLLCVMHGDVYE